MNRKMICINCPRGCRLEVGNGPRGEMIVSGAGCRRGEDYARQEVTAPRRTVTAVVRCDDPALPFVPVRTATPFPKERISSLLNRLYGMTIHGPVVRGDVIIQDIDGTGVALVAAESSRPVS